MVEQDAGRLKRVREAHFGLVGKGATSSQQETARLLGYSKSSLSQILNGKVPVSDKFIKKLKSLDEALDVDLNLDYIKTGEGELFVPKPEGGTSIGRINIVEGDNSRIDSDGDTTVTAAALPAAENMREKVLLEKNRALTERNKSLQREVEMLQDQIKIYADMNSAKDNVIAMYREKLQELASAK